MARHSTGTILIGKPHDRTNIA